MVNRLRFVEVRDSLFCQVGCVRIKEVLLYYQQTEVSFELGLWGGGWWVKNSKDP